VTEAEREASVGETMREGGEREVVGLEGSWGWDTRLRREEKVSDDDEEGERG